MSILFLILNRFPSRISGEWDRISGRIPDIIKGRISGITLGKSKDYFYSGGLSFQRLKIFRRWTDTEKLVHSFLVELLQYLNKNRLAYLSSPSLDLDDAGEIANVRLKLQELVPDVNGFLELVNAIIIKSIILWIRNPDPPL